MLGRLTDDITLRLIFGSESEKLELEPILDNVFCALDAKKKQTERIFSITTAIFPVCKPLVSVLNSRLRTNNYYNNQLFRSLAQEIERRINSWNQITQADRSEFSYLNHLLSLSNELENDNTDTADEFSYSGRQVEITFLHHYQC